MEVVLFSMHLKSVFYIYASLLFYLYILHFVCVWKESERQIPN